MYFFLINPTTASLGDLSGRGSIWNGREVVAGLVYATSSSFEYNGDILWAKLGGKTTAKD